MLKKDNFFKNYFIRSKNYNRNLNKTKKIFKNFINDLENQKIPMLESYKKNYEFEFSNETIKKYLKYKNIIIIGMGGSILGAKSIYSFFKKRIKRKVFFFDNLDENLNIEFKKIKNLNNSCFVVISKSGNTLETITNLSTIFSKKIKNKLIIITEITDNALLDIANKYNAEIVEHKNFIGGRYSVLSETGMFPASLMGLNPFKFKKLDKLIKNKNFITSLISNVAAIYTLNTQGIKNSVIFSYDSNLNDLGYWYQQLTAESLGKNGKGINPMLSFGPKDHHSLLQLYLDGPKDKFFTFLSTSNKKSNFKISKNFIPNNIRFLKNKNSELVLKAQCSATKNIFKLRKIPFREVIFRGANEDELGTIFTFFVLETLLLSNLMNVDPFNQPAVEQVKKETKKFLI